MKNPNTKTLFLLFTTLLFSFSQCTLDKNDIQPDYEIEVGQSESHAISGVVVDENNQPVNNARVEIMGSITETDENGFFYVDKAKVYSKHAYVKVVKSGYFLGSRSFYPTSGTNIVDIKLLKKKLAGRFDATTGGTISFESVSIDMGSGFVTESGTTYTGNVNVNGAYIDPTADDINEIMPGSLRAISTDGESLLASFGMMVVELTDDNGNKLQLAEGNTAEISSPIPSELESTAPNTLPLWYFNEDKGYWVKEGEAKKVGNKYVGTVNHFSFWNCDIRIDAREANGTILHENGSAVQNVRILMRTSQAGDRQGNTCSKGQYKGLMPININIEFRISGGPEGLQTFIVNKTIPETGIIEPITIPDSYFPEPIAVTGTIVDCDDKTTEDARLVLGGRYVVPTTNGTFAINLLSNSSHTMTLRHKTESLRQDLPNLKVGSLTMNLGNLKYCPDNTTTDQLDVNFLTNVKSFKASYEIDGSTHTINSGFRVGENKDKNQMSIHLGDVTQTQYLNITMLSDLKMDGQPHFYTFSENKMTKWQINFSTDQSPNGQIIPNTIRIDFLKWDISPGGYSKIVFFGEFVEYDKATKRYINRSLTNGLIEFTMAD
ncbi:MAG: hypothetical protein ACI9JN_001081 [Bacteroidia bacterium]|jgi:hypothetical protein